MSSIIRRIAQIPTRTKYLLVVASDLSENDAADSPAFVLDGAWPVTMGTIAMPASALNDVATARPLTAGALYRDMGRQIIVASDAAGAPHLAHYRAAQLVNGADSEGVGAFSEIYIRVWAADGQNVAVARTG